MASGRFELDASLSHISAVIEIFNLFGDRSD